jgi:hydroxymethylpyrimidine pyrophosphatase-like HAD family hydrolase
MALTLVEASKLSNDTLLSGVIETIAQESPILQRLPFIEIVGNGLTYNRENTSPTAAFYDVGDTWTEDTPTFTQATATLKVMGGDADIDNFLKSTRSNLQDLEASVVQLKARAVRSLFDTTFVNGNVSTNAKSFDGIDRLCVAGQTVSMGTNGASLSLAKLDELIGAGLDPARTAYMGDDIPDLRIMERVALPCCPADAAEEVKAISRYISHKPGGMGCVRDLLEQAMKVQDKWLTAKAHTW